MKTGLDTHVFIMSIFTQLDMPIHNFSMKWTKKSLHIHPFDLSSLLGTLSEDMLFIKVLIPRSLLLSEGFLSL